MKIVLVLILSTIFCFGNNLKWDFIHHYGNPMNMKAIDNCDSNNIMIIANYMNAFRNIFKSTDAGLSWNIVFKETFGDTSKPVKSRDIEYVTKDFCIVACDSGRYLKTTDGGENWKEYYTGLIEDFHGFVNLSMFDENHGVMASIYHMIVSHDGFETWEEVDVPWGILVYDVEMVSPYTIHCLSRFLDGTVTMDVKFFSSKDGGHNWTEYYHPDYKLPFSMKFLDSLIGYNIGGVRTEQGDSRRDIIYKTINGGQTWELILDTFHFPYFGIREMDIFDKNNAIFVGQFGKIWRTTDGGNSFMMDSVPKIVDMLPPTMAVCMLSPETSIICDYVGRIFRSSLATGISDIKNYDFQIYPNPATDFLSITSIATIDKIKIFNIVGECVLVTESKNIIDISALNNGLYFVELISSSNSSIMSLIIKR